MLEQIGIFTKRAGAFAAESADWQTTQMGLLQIDTTILDKMLKDHFREVEQLFASDTDGDIIRDSGVAYKINQTLQLALGLTGFWTRKSNRIRLQSPV
jgi:flagellar capping protein FliD